MFHSFRLRILIVFAGLLIAAQTGTFLFLQQLSIKNANSSIRQDLEITGKLFRHSLNERFIKLADDAYLLSSDFGFKSAVATDDMQTIKSAVINHSNRIGADLMVVFDTRGRFVATSTDDTPEEIKSSFGIFTDKLDEIDGDISGIIILNNKAYQMVLVPLMAPTHLAWVSIGFAVSNIMANDLKNLTGVDVSFIKLGQYDLGATGKNRINTLTSMASMGKARQVQLLASTLSKETFSSLIPDLHQNVTEHTTFPLKIGDETYVSKIINVSQTPQMSIRAVLKSSLNQVMAPYNSFLRAFFLISALALVFSLIFSIILARGISRPITQLEKAAHRIARGDYTALVNIEQKDELGRLGKAFNSMAAGLAERDRMEYMANHDPLTGLTNRAGFLTSLAEAVVKNKTSQKQYAVMFIDLDGFKPINDTHGHDVGDNVLKIVAGRLSAAVRANDLVARLGGDEFVILFRDVSSREKLEDKAQDILRRLEQTMAMDDNCEVNLSASLGIALTRKDNADTLIKCADEAMYKAKKGGKRTYCFYGEDPVQPGISKAS